MVKQIEIQSSFHSLPSLPSRLSVAGSPRLLVLSHTTAGIHGQSHASAQTLQHIINTISQTLYFLNLVFRSARIIYKKQSI